MVITCVPETVPVKSCVPDWMRKGIGVGRKPPPATVSLRSAVPRTACPVRWSVADAFEKLTAYSVAIPRFAVQELPPDADGVLLLNTVVPARVVDPEMTFSPAASVMYQP